MFWCVFRRVFITFRGFERNVMFLGFFFAGLVRFGEDLYVLVVFGRIVMSWCVGSGSSLSWYSRLSSPSQLWGPFV